MLGPLFFASLFSASSGHRHHRHWVSLSGPQYLALRTWVSGPRHMHIYKTSKALHPTIVLFFSRHFSLRPLSLFFCRHFYLRLVVTDRQTHARTHITSDFIYKTSGCSWRSDTIRPCLPFFFFLHSKPIPQKT